MIRPWDVISHSMGALRKTKPMAPAIRVRLRPKRSDRAPKAGVAIAYTMAMPVVTHSASSD